MTGITFDPTTRRLILGHKPCTWCGNYTDRGIPAGREVKFRGMTCTKCKGTGKRGNGKCRACKVESWQRNPEYPIGQVRDYDAPYDAGPCKACEGSTQVLATMGDYVPKDVIAEILEYMPIKVYARARELSWGEAHLGILTDTDGRRYPFPLGSVVDYGRAAEEYLADKDAFVDTMRAKIANDSHQACKIADKTGLVLDHIAILLAKDGYTMLAVPATLANTPEV